jgi:FdhD protein
MSKTQRVHVQRVEAGELVESADDMVLVEEAVSITVDGALRVESTCSPGELAEWVVGYLFSEGWIGSPEDVGEIWHDDGAYVVRLHAPTRPGPLERLESDLVLGVGRIYDVAADVMERSAALRKAGEAHAAAIANGEGIRVFVEDVRRTCAFEKAIGEAVLMGVDFSGSLAFLTSPVGLRAIEKSARCGIPVVATSETPTGAAVRLAEELRVCLCGVVRGEQLNVYAQGWRLGL